MTKLYLASASPRRRELLTQLGFAFEVISLDVPEVKAVDETPAQYGQRVALLKAHAGLAGLGHRHGVVVLGADTEVVLDNEVFGKPRDAEHARAILMKLSGRTHDVLSAVSVTRANASLATLQVSKVRFKSLSDVEITDYIATGEPFGKAGAYGIQGRAAAFVEHLQGSYTGVMGLPLFETYNLLTEFGLRPGTNG